ncbi:alcohol dehydrogenase catalytic domain-containing protein [Amnibacterium soli]|uniref:alcohol dehydrogenase catalytic domain-containing protein n=1 Tax=Amnibacterium soli TaxID=1282736 RepID=UPI003CD08303
MRRVRRRDGPRGPGGAGPGAREVVVRVVAAGTNPGEVGIRSGALASMFPAVFPEGQGSDLAGVVAAAGPGVSGVAVGEPVIGLSDGRNAQAELVLLPASRVVPKPEALDWDVAATLYVAGTTALALLQTVPVAAGDTVVVAGAAGGVGVFLTQLAVGTGARVLAVAGEANHDWLRQHGAESVAYGDGLEDRLRAAAPDGVAAFFDLFGNGYTDLAVALGAAPERVATVADFAAGDRLGVQVTGMAALEDPAQGVRTLAAIASEGGFEVPIKGRFPLEQVQDAYREVSRRSGLGKVVLQVSAP